MMRMRQSTGLKESVRQIDALDVAAAEPAEVANTNAVKDRADAGILVDDVADGRRTDEETIVVVVESAVVFVVGDEKFGGVAREKGILQISVGNGDLLAAALECVEAAVGVFFEEMEVGEIVFNAIAVEVAEDSQGGFFVDKKKSAKVGVELLDADLRGNEIVIRAEVVEFHLDESFLETNMVVEAVGTAPRIGPNESELADSQIVDAELRSDSNAPIDGLEGRVAMK